MTAIFRPTRRDELEAIDALVVASINDLTERHGFGSMAVAAPPRFADFSLRDDPRGLWTAEEDGAITGFAFGWACEDFWFLAQLFVQSSLQSRGTGQALLQKALEHADAIGATQRALITFAFNTVSQGLYLRNGFTPRFPVYSMSGRRQPVRNGAQALPEAALMNGSDEELRQLAEVDRQALGFSREKHHGYLAGEPGLRGYLLQSAGRTTGYAYISAGGHIGPLAVVSPDLLERAFEKALDLAADIANGNASCFLPGSNAGLVRAAMGHGLRIRFPMLMMSTRDMGGWPCYLPRNPGFM